MKRECHLKFLRANLNFPFPFMRIIAQHSFFEFLWGVREPYGHRLAAKIEVFLFLQMLVEVGKMEVKVVPDATDETVYFTVRNPSLF